MNKLKIAFDWEGTLDSHYEMRNMALQLQHNGWEVIIVSAMPITMKGIREKVIEDFGLSLPYVVVYHELEDYHKEAAKAKINYLKENGINLIIDDNIEVCKIMKNAGITVLQIL